MTGPIPTPGDQFALLAALPDPRIDLGRAALLLAADEYPDLDIDHALRRLDMLAANVAERIDPDAGPVDHADVLCEYLFRQRGFAGDTENYFDPRNSYLNDVLERRVGLPITLSVLAIEVGRRAGLPVRGVGLPGHFVCRYDAPGVELFFDPFHGGRHLTAAECHEIALRAMNGYGFSNRQFLEPVGPRAILTRMLVNLKGIYLHQGDMERTVRTVDRLLHLNPGSAGEHRDRGLLHLGARRWHAALQDLSAYLTLNPEAPDADLVHRRIEGIWETLKRG